VSDPADQVCAFGPDGEHCDVVAACDVCLKPTCDLCGYGHNDEEDDWLCPDHQPEGEAAVPEIGARVTFTSIADGREYTGFVAEHRDDGGLRVMDVLEPPDGTNWSWSEWILAGEWRLA
jgi:hypothetical protein